MAHKRLATIPPVIKLAPQNNALALTSSADAYATIAVFSVS